jgi:hypothetical protein
MPEFVHESNTIKTNKIILSKSVKIFQSKVKVVHIFTDLKKFYIY